MVFIAKLKHTVGLDRCPPGFIIDFLAISGEKLGTDKLAQWLLIGFSLKPIDTEDKNLLLLFDLFTSSTGFVSKRLWIFLAVCHFLSRFLNLMVLPYTTL